MVRHARGRLPGGEAGGRRRRHALSLVPDETPPRRSRTPGASSSEAGCAAVKVEGGRRDAPGRRSDPRRRHPGDGTRRPDASVVPEVRRLQGPGTRARPRPARSSRTRRPSPRRDASRSFSSACPSAGGGDHARDRRPHDRHRRRAVLRRTGPGLSRRDGPVARTCARASSGATRTSPPIIEEAARAFTRDVKSGSFPSEEESFSERQSRAAPRVS